MLLAVHATVGAVAGNAVSSPSVALILGFLSHFFLDAIPHGDHHMYEQFSSGRKARQAFLYVGLDTLATAVIIALFFLRQDFFSPVNVAMGIIGGLLPDLLVGLYEVYKPRRRWFERKLSWFNDFHMRNHKLVISRVRRFKDDIPLRYSLILQGIALFFLMRAML